MVIQRRINVSKLEMAVGLIGLIGDEAAIDIGGSGVVLPVQGLLALVEKFLIGIREMLHPGRLRGDR